MPQAYWIIPLEGGHISNELPGGGHASPPIYHPGHPDHGRPVDPGYGRPGWRPTDPGFGQGGRPHPGNRPPGSWSGHIDNALPEGEEVEISNELPPVPPQYEDKVVVAVKRPGQEWTVTAYDPNSGIDNTLPPAPEPK